MTHRLDKAVSRGIASLLHPTLNSPWIERHQNLVALLCFLACFALGWWMIVNGAEINRRWGWGSYAQAESPGSLRAGFLAENP